MNDEWKCPRDEFIHNQVKTIEWIQNEMKEIKEVSVTV